MKSKGRIRLAALLALALMLALAAGCSGSGNGGNAGNNGGDSGSGNKGGNTEEAAGPPMENGKYSPEVTITTVKSFDDSMKFKNGETIENNVFTKWAKDKLGINIKYLWTTPTANDAFKTKLMLSLTANEPMPDILDVPNYIAQDMIDSGKFQPVGELFDKYASENYKKAMAEVPSAWLPYVRDGKKYGIPGIDYIMQHDDALWIRQDWLDKLNLKAPTNIDEFEQVMDAFVNGDPDGNGKKDTYGMALTLKANYNAWIGGGPLFGAFGAIPQAWQKDENGDIVYGSVRPEIKQTLTKFKEWIDKGYFHKEVALQDEMKASELFTSGKAGMAMGPTWLYEWPLQDVVKNVPDAVVKPYPLPVGPDGKLMQKSEGTHYMVTLINKDMKNPEIFFTLENYLYDHYNDPEAGGEFEYGFADGYDYAMIDGKAEYDTAKIPGGYVDPQKYFLIIPPRTPSAFIQTLADLYNGKEPTTPYEKKLANGSKIQMEAADIVVSQHEHTIDDLFTGAPTPTMEDKWANLTKMEQQTFTKIMYGEVGPEAFDQFVKDWNAAGGEQVTKEVRDWYKAAGGE